MAILERSNGVFVANMRIYTSGYSTSMELRAKLEFSEWVSTILEFDLVANRS